MPIDLGPTPPQFSEMMQGVQVRRTGSNVNINFADELKARGGVIIVGFLRHFSCPLCQKKASKWDTNLKSMVSKDTTILIVSNGTVQEGVDFASKFDWPALNLFTDPELNTYRALSFAQGYFSTLGKISAYLNGSCNTDHLQLGGVVVVDGAGYVRYFHRESFAGDHANLVELVKFEQLAQKSYDSNEN